MLHPYAHAIQRSARRWPERDAVIDVAADRRLTWAELADRCARLAGGLVDKGAGPGHRVAVVQANVADYVVAIGGIAWAGAAFAPLLGSMSAAEREQAIASIDPTDVLDASDAEDIQRRVADGAAVDPVQAVPTSLSQILFTSGSTGAPKGVMHSFAGTQAAMTSWVLVATPSTESTMLVTSPISHAAGRLLEGVMPTGGRIVILPSARAEIVVPAIDRYRVTHMIVVPTVLQELIDAPVLAEHDLSSLRFVMYSTAPAAPSLLQRARERLGPVLHTVWGATECPAPNTLLGPEEHDRAVDEEPGLLRSCGRELSASVQLRVVDDDLRDVPDGTVGQILVSAPWMAVGYWGREDLWAERMRDDWFIAGDLARIDNGYVYLADRKEDMIISGGFNVFPAEVEALLADHPAVREAVVLGLPDRRWGEAVTAVVSLYREVDVEELIRHCREGLTAYKVPKRVVVLDEVPKTGHGKISRRHVRSAVFDTEASVHGVE